MKYLYLTSFIILLSLGLTRAQSICDPLRPMGNHCTNAPLICDWEELVDYCFTMSPDLNFNGFAPLCFDKGSPHNTHWLSFYAGCTDMLFSITPEDCVLVLDGLGIQVVVYEFDAGGSCDDLYNPYSIIHCHAEPAILSPYVLELSDLTIGHIYYIMIDGYSGSYCDYVGISLLTPCEKPVIEPWQAPIDGPTSFCTGGTAEYSVSPPQGASNYHWFLDGVEVQDHSLPHLYITWALPGTYELCVNASSACIPMVQGQGLNCITVEVYDVIPVDPPPILLCEGESSPFPPGIYDILLQSIQGCDSLVTLTVLEDPTVYNHLGQFILCDLDSISISGVNYTCSSSGKYHLPYKKSAFPFCDSIVQFDIACFEPKIKPHDILNSFEDVVLLDGDLGLDASGRFVTYQWFTTNGVLPDTTDLPTLSVRHHGQYCLITSLFDVDSTVLCVDTVCTEVIRIIEVPGGFECQDATLLCDLSATYHLTMRDSITGNGPSPLCVQGGLPENTHWFAFFAPDSLLTLHYLPSNCTVKNGGYGVQVALYQYDGNGLCINSKETPAFDIGCESFCFASPWSVSVSQLQPGALYYLVINGCKGSSCDVEFSFEYTHPSDPEPFTWEGDIQGPNEICANVNSLYYAPPAPPFSRYTWHINDTFFATTVAPSLPITWSEGGDYNLCVTLEHACLDSLDGPGEHCYPVKVIPGVTRTAKDVYLCKDDVQLSYGAWWSCAHEGEHQTTYQQKLEPHCDSVVRFQVICLSPEVIILNPEPIPGDSLHFLDGTQSSPGPLGTSVTWEWTAYNGGIIEGPTDQPTAIGKYNGLFCLTIETASPNGSVKCTDTDCVQIGSLREASEGPADMMHLYPSPASEMVWVHVDAINYGPGKLLIYNSLGQVVHRIDKDISVSPLEINVSHWPQGLYTVSLFMDQEQDIVTKRMLVIRN